MPIRIISANELATVDRFGTIFRVRRLSGGESRDVYAAAADGKLAADPDDSRRLRWLALFDREKTPGVGWDHLYDQDGELIDFATLKPDDVPTTVELLDEATQGVLLDAAFGAVVVEDREKKR